MKQEKARMAWKQSLTNGFAKISLVWISLACTPAFAGTLGGLQKATSVAKDVRDGMYALLGVGVFLYLIYLAIMAFTEKKTWADFGWGVVYVAVAGGIIAIGEWAWSLFA